MAPPSPAKPQTLKAGPPAQAPASCSANLLRSHRREGGRVPTDTAPGWKPRLRVAGVRGKEHPLSGRRETQCRLQSPPPRPRGPRRWRCVGRDGDQKQDVGGMQATGTRPCTWGAPARRRPCSPPSSAPPQARLTAEAPSPRPRPSPSPCPCPRPTAPAAQRGVGPAGRSPRGRGPRGAAPHLAAPLRRVSGWGRPRAGEDASLQTQRRQAETHSTGRLHAELRTPKPTVGGP